MNTLLRKIFLLLSFIIGTAIGDRYQQEEGFISLFDGETLKAWEGNPKFWSVQEGAITGITTKENPVEENTFLIWRGGVVDNFELRLKVKIAGGNSGIQYRSEDHGNWVMSGYQGDFEYGTAFSGILYHEKGRGILARRGEKTVVTNEGGKHKVSVVGSLGDTDVIQAVIKQDQWNDYKVIARGYEFTHVINGRVTAEVTDLDKKGRKPSGLLGLQLHAGPPMRVQFKDIRIKPLDGINISGKWRFLVETDQGTGEPEFDLKQDGETLTGTYSGLFGTQPVKGIVKGNRFSMTVEGNYDGQVIVSIYEGKIVGFEYMKGSVDFNEQFKATWTARKY
ncbi:MAG: hypothetical protein M2R45_01780 [Verrucomicrobia subdivision 3 bacterium]|nr:hypothetical protein [Limisphaerales bacterium]MCS1415865.1 hypothetical protein [Limisphaerales bacterium]